MLSQLTNFLGLGPASSTTESQKDDKTASDFTDIFAEVDSESDYDRKDSNTVIDSAEPDDSDKNAPDDDKVSHPIDIFAADDPEKTEMVTFGESVDARHVIRKGDSPLPSSNTHFELGPTGSDTNLLFENVEPRRKNEVVAGRDAPSPTEKGLPGDTVMMAQSGERVLDHVLEAGGGKLAGHASGKIGNQFDISSGDANAVRTDDTELSAATTQGERSSIVIGDELELGRGTAIKFSPNKSFELGSMEIGNEKLKNSPAGLDIAENSSKEVLLASKSVRSAEVSVPTIVSESDLSEVRQNGVNPQKAKRDLPIFKFGQDRIGATPISTDRMVGEIDSVRRDFAAKEKFDAVEGPEIDVAVRMSNPRLAKAQNAIHADIAFAGESDTQIKMPERSPVTDQGARTDLPKSHKVPGQTPAKPQASTQDGVQPVQVGDGNALVAHNKTNQSAQIDLVPQFDPSIEWQKTKNGAAPHSTHLSQRTPVANGIGLMRDIETETIPKRSPVSKDAGQAIEIGTQAKTQTGPNDLLGVDKIELQTRTAPIAKPLAFGRQATLSSSVTGVSRDSNAAQTNGDVVYRVKLSDPTAAPLQAMKPTTEQGSLNAPAIPIRETADLPEAKSIRSRLDSTDADIDPSVRSEAFVGKTGAPEGQAPKQVQTLPLPAMQAGFGRVTSPHLADFEDEISLEELQPAGPAFESRAQSGVAPQSTTLSRAEANPVLRQIADGIARLGDGSVEIRLSPEELGNVRLQMSQGDTSMTVHITADRPETLDLMRRHIDQLARDLAEAGYEGAEFTFGDGNSGGYARRQQTDDDASNADLHTAPPPSQQPVSEGLDLRF